MPYSNDLTANKKAKLFPIKLDEQSCCCILCKQPFEPSILWEQSTNFDHLDNNEKNNDPSNLAIVHIECNLIKKFNADYQILASDWHKYLVSKIPTSLSESVSAKKSESEENTQTQASTQAPTQPEELTDGQINLIINKLTKSLLETEFPEDSTKQIPFSVMLADIHFLTMQEANGRGSEPSARRALNGMTRSKYSPYQQKKLGQGNIIIQRRESIPIKKKLPETPKSFQEMESS